MSQKPVRPRAKAHLIFVAGHSCMICGRTDVQAHHLLSAQPKAMSKKSGDQWSVPLCVIHHRMLHEQTISGRERDFMRSFDCDHYLELATNLARESPSKKIRKAAGL